MEIPRQHPRDTTSVLEDIRIGVVVPPGSLLDHEYGELVGSGRRVYVSRTDGVAGEMERVRAEALAEPSLVVPAVRRIQAVKPHVVAFACTSGSFISGDAAERRICRTMEAAGASRAVTTSGSLRDLLSQLRVDRVAVATPYGDQLTNSLARFLGESGITVSSRYSLGIKDPLDVARIGPSTLAQMVEAVDEPCAQAIFLSCTNLPTLGMARSLSVEADKPVLSSNLVTMWGALTAIGDDVGASRASRDFGVPQLES
jgi:maleate cis-trans isomerase